jgi:signal transduction histidine kinase
MVRLVNDLLNVTRIESGRLRVFPEPTNVEKLVNSVLAEAKPLAKLKKVTIDFEVKTIFSEILLDKNLFRQCVHNLITNAIRYSKQKSGKVKIVLNRNNKKYFTISVSDNGIGIPKESQGRIFEKFFRADNAIKTVTEGTGLGLYLIKMIVTQSNGEVWFDSKVGKGTTFFIKLPVSGMKKKKGEQGFAFS